MEVFLLKSKEECIRLTLGHLFGPTQCQYEYSLKRNGLCLLMICYLCMEYVHSSSGLDSALKVQSQSCRLLIFLCWVLPGNYRVSCPYGGNSECACTQFGWSFNRQACRQFLGWIFGCRIRKDLQVSVQVAPSLVLCSLPRLQTNIHRVFQLYRLKDYGNLLPPFSTRYSLFSYSSCGNWVLIGS